MDEKPYDFVRVHGNRIDLCVLRTDEEAVNLYTKWINDESINIFIGSSDTVSYRYSQEDWATQERDPDTCTFSIVDKTTRNLIGICTSNLICGSARTANLSICIGEKNYQDKGYGTEVMKLLIRFAFYQQNAHRIELFVNSNNKRAIKCYEKCGLKIAGCRHEASYYDGKYSDLYLMELLKSDYKENL